MSRRSAERRCARPEMSEAGVQTSLKYAGPVPRIQSKAVAATLYSPDQWCMFCTPSLAVFRTRYNQVDSTLVNLDATVKV